MARVATKKQKAFAREYIDSGNGTQAALKTYDTTSKDVAKSIASENLTKPNVRALIDGYAEKAATNIQTLAERAKNESVRLNANKDQLDRAGYNTIDKSISLQAKITPNERIKAIAEWLKSGKNGNRPDDNN